MSSKASGPSVGICPFCKMVMSNADGVESISVETFAKLYNDGKLERALSFGTALYKSKPELKSDLSFVITYVKVLIEAEAPSSQLRSILTEAQLAMPQNTDLLDYFEIIDAKACRPVRRRTYSR